MPFQRYLADRFIDQLNELYDNRTSWWRALVGTKGIYLAIRPKNAINAYAGGAAIARVEWNQRQGVSFLIHHKYLVFPAPRNPPYVNLLAPQVIVDAITVDGPDQFAEHLGSVIRAASSLGGEERAAENVIACNNRCVLDMEVVYEANGAEADETRPTRRKKGGRIDLIVQCHNKLVAVEIKLRSNAELRATPPAAPVVATQLLDYHTWMSANVEENVEEKKQAYNNVLDYYDRLKGEFFEMRRRDERIEEIDDVPRLLITGFRTPDKPDVRAAGVAVGNACAALKIEVNVIRVGGAGAVQCQHFCGNPGRKRGRRGAKEPRKKR